MDLYKQSDHFYGAKKGGSLGVFLQSPPWGQPRSGGG